MVQSLPQAQEGQGRRPLAPRDPNLSPMKHALGWPVSWEAALVKVLQSSLGGCFRCGACSSPDLTPNLAGRFGWVLEMWGYSIAAASLGIEHKVMREFQTEGGAGIGAPTDRFIFHYTYGIEYTLGGRPMTGQIGEWSLDKRHYGTAYPPRNLQAAPNSASAGAHWLLNAFNEASAGIPAWPETKALGTVGWRQSAGDGIRGSALAERMEGTKWTWAGITGLEFESNGRLKTPWGHGVWGILPKGMDYRDGGAAAPQSPSSAVCAHCLWLPCPPFLGFALLTNLCSVKLMARSVPPTQGIAALLLLCAASPDVPPP